MDAQLQMFLWGVMGSLGVDIITVANYFNRGRPFPKRYRRALFYFTRALVAVLGGSLAIAYSIPESVVNRALLAINIGASTPLIIQQFTRGLPSDNDPE